PRVHHREGPDSLGGAHGPPPRGRRRPPRLPYHLTHPSPPRGEGRVRGERVRSGESAREKGKMKTLIKNIATIVSGDIARPWVDGDSVVVADGAIAAVGRGLDVDADTVIDARGSTVIPGLIDSHCHPVFGDFTPRQRTIDFIESGLNGGLTTMISAGEVHLPGRPKDIAGLKSVAVVRAAAYANLRPAGVKVHGGAPILELGMVEEDFAEMARHGVKLVGEIGLGSVKTGKDAAPMVRWAKQHGMTVTIHTGGPSIAGSN